MSIMSQARLTSFSQNQLARVIRHHNFGLKNCCNIQNGNKNQQTDFNKPQPCAISGCLLLAGHKMRKTAIKNYNEICKLDAFDYTQLYTTKESFTNKIVVNKLATTVENVNSTLHNIESNPNLFRNMLLSQNVARKQLSVLYNRYLLDNLRVHNPSSEQHCGSSEESDRERAFCERSVKFKGDKHSQGKTRDRFESRSLIGVMGIVGFMRGLTSSDIEDEKAKLLDEQKMKRMTPAELLIAKGVLSMCDQEYLKASELFHGALRLAQDENNDEQETLLLNLLASNSFECGDYEGAEKLLIDLMKRMIAKDVEPTDLAILELSLKLASIYSRNPNTHDKAIKGFKFVINTLLVNLEDLLNHDGELESHDVDEDKKDELALLGWSYDWFAKHLLAINDYESATILLKRAQQISSAVLGPLHDQTLILLNDIGTTMAMNDYPEEGRIFMKKAVEGALESKSKELASFYVNLGLVNLRLRLFSEARRYCEYSNELALKDREHYNSDDVIKLSRSCLTQIDKIERQ